MEQLRRIAANRLSHIAFAFCVLGGWAVWANRMHPMPAPLVAGLVQGLISATITIALQRIIEWVFARSQNAMLAMIAAALFSLATITGIHTAAGTPEVLATITVPWLVGCSYIVLYTLALRKKSLA